jgi:tRNA1(Val) A37 N6-methylase TrmN6
VSTYAANNAASYQQSMGRWSQRLAPLFIQFARPLETTSILDVGCGTGSLSFALSDNFPDVPVTAIDYSQSFID